MSELRTYRGTARTAVGRTQDPEIIRAQLHGLGVVFAQFELPEPPPEVDATQDEIIEGHRELLNALMREHQFETLDVLSITPEYPRLEKLVQDFQHEHLHPDLEARLFLSGCGCFFLRTDNAVYAVFCERGDFLSLPAGMSHWFDMGDSPNLCTVRLYAQAHGWQAIPTGNDMRGTYPEVTTELGRKLRSA